MKWRIAVVVAVLAAAGLVAVLPTVNLGQAAPATYTVDSTGDGGDFSTADGVCDTDDSVGDGPCTLRAAIEQANVNVGADTINFSITGAGPHTIQPASTLPTITDPVTIDGTSEPDFVSSPIVELDGTNAGESVDGLSVTAGSSTIKGLVINRFGGDGIELSTNGGNVIEGNYIGTDTAGTVDQGNGANGVQINDVGNNTIGGTTASKRNVISGNDNHGVLIQSSGATGNVVEGNYIGTDKDGTGSLGNTSDGVRITSSASDNTIGGTDSGAGNTIAHNTDNGVVIFGPSTTGNTIRGNSIHTNGSSGILHGAGGNHGLGPPVIDSVGPVSGHTDPKCYPCTTEIFSDDEDEGRIYHGSATTNDDATGTWTYSGAVTGPNITATVTNALGSTCVFSDPFVLPALTITAAAITFPGVTLDGTDQTVNDNTSAAWRADATGQSGGWKVTVASTDFDNGASKTIAVSNFEIRLLDANIVRVSGDTDKPVSTQTTFGALSGTALKIASAASGTGDGVYDLTPDFRLTVPAETYADSYTATVTVAISAGP